MKDGKARSEKLRVAALLVVALLIAAPVHAGGPDDILGEWLTENADTKILIFKCGKAKEQFCGRTVWLKEPHYPANDREAGKAKHDRENADSAKRERPLMGMFLIWGLRYNQDEWVDGKYYNPREAKTYNCKMSLESPNRLKVRGFVGVSLFGKTLYWSR